MKKNYVNSIMSVLIFFVAMWLGWFFNTLLTSPSSPTVVNYSFTDNMQDCQVKQGEYSLNIREDGSVWYEWCEIQNKIEYHD